MNIEDISGILRDNSHTFFALLIGAIVGRLVANRRLDASRIRKKLGRKIDRYSAIPTADLDPALERAAWAGRPVLRFISAVCATAVWMGSALIAAEIFDRSFPNSPGWCSPIIAGGVAGSLAIFTMRIERFVILRRLERLQIDVAQKAGSSNRG